jgi:pimeloyl-ACP methyl ester carboxylesterase
MANSFSDRAAWPLVWLCALAALAGCSYDALVTRTAELSGWTGSDAVTVRTVPKNPLDGPLNLLSKGGPQPTPRTMQLLRRYDLSGRLDGSIPKLMEEFEAATAEEPDTDHIYALAELAYIGAKRAEHDGHTGDAMHLYGASVAQAYGYLFDPRLDKFRNPYDPHFRRACDLYNGALEGLLRLANKSKDGLRPGATHKIESGSHHYEIKIVARGAWHDDDFDHFKFTSDYEVAGLKNHYQSYGLGVPLIGVRKKHAHEEPHEQFYPDGLTFPVTALLRVHPHDSPSNEGPARRGYRFCSLELHDPLGSTDIFLGDRLAPLESDLSTPLAYFLNQPKYRGNYLGTYALLQSEESQSLRGLYMLEPYDPKKIPVVLVHGLWSTPITWMEMYNDLRSLPEIRQNYQFWFYLYPTGQPFWISAAQMREDLAHMRQTLDPGGQAPPLDQMVLIGHSMGGLVSKMQTLSSGDEFWRIVSERPFNELKADPNTLARVKNVLYFEPNPSVRRVITIATPHRGSRFSNSYTQLLGRTVITLPKMFMQTGEALVRDNPTFFKHPELLTATMTSIDSLAPESPIIPATFRAQRAPWVKYHNIIGIAPTDAKGIEGLALGLAGQIAGAGDGVVNVESAHLDFADSEVKVKAEHSSVHQHPRAILEVRNVLRMHLREAFPDWEERSSRPVGPPGPQNCAPASIPLPNAALGGLNVPYHSHGVHPPAGEPREAVPANYAEQPYGFYPGQ